MKRVSYIMLSILLLANTLAFSFNTQNVKASGTIYIRADGSVDPPTAPISTTDNVTYTLTGNITSDTDGIVIDRDNITLDGAGFIVQGTLSIESYNCLLLVDVTNVTIKNIKATMFTEGIRVFNCSNIKIIENIIMQIGYLGIGGRGLICGYNSSNVSVISNCFENVSCGLWIVNSSSSKISENTIKNAATYGIVVENDSFIFHNSFTNCSRGAAVVGSGINKWDDGYPSGGNYWSDYTGVDLHSGSYQNEMGIDGIGDTPYAIDANNTDHYPLMSPWPSGWKLDFAGPTNHPIVDFAVYNGSLYAAADNGLYVYDQSGWNVLDAPMFVTSLEPYGDKLVVGGQGGLYCYDGTSFSLIFSVPTYIKVLGVYNNTLYGGAMLDNPPKLHCCNGSADNPANWHIDTGFSTILNFSGAFGSIDSFAVYNGKMHVASGNTVYCFDGTSWSMALSYEYAYAFSDMQVYDGKLYLATRDLNRIPLYAGGTGFSGVIIEFDGENWTTVLGHDYWIYSLEVYDGKLYVGTANRIYTYDGTFRDVSFYSAEGAYYAISMINYDGKIYVGMGNGYIFADPAPVKSVEEDIVVPEFPSAAILVVFVAFTIPAAVLIKRKRLKRLN